MFFIQKRDLHNLDTVIPNSFFELVLPMLAPKEHALAVYMLGYYESVSIKEMGDRISSNQELAEVLGISVDDVYEAWEYCESLGLIKKFVLDEEVAGSYQIEFRDLRTVLGKPKGKATSTDELIAVYKNEEYKKMYDRIEQTIKYPLTSVDIQKIHKTIAEFNISKDLVIEAVLFTLYKKKSRSISMAMGVLRNWHMDGIRSVEDLEQMMQGKEQRYLEYKKILSALGEYRSPTEPEREMIDMWLDEYRFDLESILDAVSKTITIKSPNLKYVDGVLRNRLEAVSKLEPQNNVGGEIQKASAEETEFEIRTKVLELINFPRKSLRRDEKEQLDAIAKDFTFSAVEIAHKHLTREGKEVSIDALYKMLHGEPSSDKPKRITMQQVRRAEQLNKQSKTYPKAGKSTSTDKNDKTKSNEPKPMGPIEKRLLERTMARQNKKD